MEGNVLFWEFFLFYININILEFAIPSSNNKKY